MILQLSGATLAYGARTLWSGLDVEVKEGEFLAVLGGNGAGKTSLLRVVLGLRPLTSGRVTVGGQGRDAVGYVPQRSTEPLLPIRARDLVGDGLNGHRWGFGRADRTRVDAALAAVDAGHLADRPYGRLSGGEQQRIRIAQALVGDPALLLCDEILSWLDVANQRQVAAVVDQRRREHGTAVVFVTHDVNPVLPYLDRVLYLADTGRHRLGRPDQVLTTETLSELHRSPVKVVRVDGEILVAAR